jgi:CBS domain-containing protein
MKNIGIKVGDIMTRDFVSINPTTSLLDCARMMMKKRVGSLILEKENELRGIITEKDIIWALTKKSQKDLKKIKCSDISPRKMTTIKPNADLMSAIRLMQKSKFRRLPVVVKNRLVGMLTLKDILRIEPALFEIACSNNLLEIKEEKDKLKRKSHQGKFDFGMCEECGKQDFLEFIDGKMMCEECIDKM